MKRLMRINYQHLLFPAWMGLLLIIMGAGLVGAFFVFTKGLVITNLSDLVPWGLWITIDLSSIALAAGAFTMSAAVHLLGLKHLKPVAKTAVYIGIIGYTMAMMMLLMDIGRPDRFWHGFVFWNVHSPLWEVTMCVGLYFAVLVLEVIPIVGDAEFIKGRWPRISEYTHKVHLLAPVLAVAGLGLSMLHQSSLGATYGVLKARPIWYRPGMAVLFIISAAVAGPALTVLASKLAARLTPKAIINDDILDQVSRFVGWSLVLYLYLRFWDVLAMSYTYEPGRTEGLDMLTSGAFAFNFWVGEMLLGIIAPMVILLSSRLRSQPRFHILALMLVVGGLVAYRWDTNLVGQLVVFDAQPQDIIPLYTYYIPSLVEFVVGGAAVAFGLFAFTLGVKYMRVVDHSGIQVAEAEEHEMAPVAAASSG